MAEFLQLSLKIGSGFASMDFQGKLQNIGMFNEIRWSILLIVGIAIAQINQKLDKLMQNLGYLMREPLESAQSFMKQYFTNFE